jgi:Flp pilus assembly pilin Flp
MNIKYALERLRKLTGDQGQTVTEYALLVFWTVVIVLAAWKALELALMDSYQDLASLICLPIP